MNKVNLAELAEGRRMTARPLPIIQGSLSAETSYAKVLRSILVGIAKEVDRLLPEVRVEMEMTRDAVDFVGVDRLTEFLTRVGADAIFAILRLEAKRHTRKWLNSVKGAIGVDLAAVVRDEDLSEYLDRAALRNALLITGLTSDTAKRVKTTIINSLIRGEPMAALRRRLIDDFAFSQRRAKLIARDQIAKLNSDLNRIRHEQAGIHRYIWRTAMDERVRDLHQSLEGKVYEYGQPTGAEEGLPPGQPINCRCISQPVLEARR